MSFADHRAQFLRNRVLTATPAQRVVMIYDRLQLDLNLARSNADDIYAVGQHIGHAMQIVAELQSSLDRSVGGPADNLAALYTFVLQKLISARGGALECLDAVESVMTPLRSAWAEAAEIVAADAPIAAGSGSWVS